MAIYSWDARCTTDLFLGDKDLTVRMSTVSSCQIESTRLNCLTGQGGHMGENARLSTAQCLRREREVELDSDGTLTMHSPGSAYDWKTILPGINENDVLMKFGLERMPTQVGTDVSTQFEAHQIENIIPVEQILWQQGKYGRALQYAESRQSRLKERFASTSNHSSTLSDNSAASPLWVPGAEALAAPIISLVANSNVNQRRHAAMQLGVAPTAFDNVTGDNVRDWLSSGVDLSSWIQGDTASKQSVSDLSCGPSSAASTIGNNRLMAVPV